MKTNQIQPSHGGELALPFADNGQDVDQKVMFPNGYGVSIIRCYGSYGHRHGLFEVGGLYDGELTDIAGVLPETVKGWLDIPGVLDIMQQVRDLPALVPTIEAAATKQVAQ